MKWLLVFWTVLWHTYSYCHEDYFGRHEFVDNTKAWGCFFRENTKNFDSLEDAKKFFKEIPRGKTNTGDFVKSIYVYETGNKGSKNIMHYSFEKEK